MIGPAPGDGGRAAGVPAGTEGREAPGEDRDDREGDGEVGKARPRPVQILPVAELGESSLVFVQLDGVDCLRHVAAPFLWLLP